jgi:hypothetical protein
MTYTDAHGDPLDGPETFRRKGQGATPGRYTKRQAIVRRTVEVGVTGR